MKRKPHQYKGFSQIQTMFVVVLVGLGAIGGLSSMGRSSSKVIAGLSSSAHTQHAQSTSVPTIGSATHAASTGVAARFAHTAARAADRAAVAAYEVYHKVRNWFQPTGRGFYPDVMRLQLRPLYEGLLDQQDAQFVAALKRGEPTAVLDQTAFPPRSPAEQVYFAALLDVHEALGSRFDAQRLLEGRLRPNNPVDVAMFAPRFAASRGRKMVNFDFTSFDLQLARSVLPAETFKRLETLIELYGEDGTTLARRNQGFPPSYMVREQGSIFTRNLRIGRFDANARPAQVAGLESNITNIFDNLHQAGVSPQAQRYLRHMLEEPISEVHASSYGSLKNWEAKLTKDVIAGVLQGNADAAERAILDIDHSIRLAALDVDREARLAKLIRAARVAAGRF